MLAEAQLNVGIFEGDRPPGLPLPESFGL